MRQADTPAGRFSIHAYEVPEAYTLSRMPKLNSGEGGYEIITIDQAVKIGEEIYTPVLYQNCMHPEQITIYPLEITGNGSRVLFQDHYHAKRVMLKETEVTVMPWYPVLRPGGCMPCRNCGRC